MSHSLRTLAAVGACLASLSLSAGTEASEGGDLSRLQGRWSARAGARRAIQVTLEIQGQRVDVFFTTPQGVRIRFRGEVKLDERSSPRRPDWINFTGADQQDFPSILAIYKIDRDMFTVCNGGLHGSRPTEFKPGEGALAEIVVFRRIGTSPADRATQPLCPNSTIQHSRP
jgi:uncharacterized protein (TIGR03067 family)